MGDMNQFENAAAIPPRSTAAERWLHLFGLLLLDGALLAAAIGISILLRFETGFRASGASGDFFGYLPVYEAVFLPVLLLGGFYRIYWKYAGLHEIVLAFILCAASGGIVYIFNGIFSFGFSRAVIVMAAVFAALAIVASRIFGRGVRYLHRTALHMKNRDHYKRVMIIGAGSGGANALALYKKKTYENIIPVLFVDDDPAKRSYRFDNVPVLGGRRDIPGLAMKHNIQEIVISVNPANIVNMDELIQLCRQTTCRIRLLAGIDNIDKNQTAKAWFKDLDIADFLMRNEEHLDLSSVSAYLKDKTVLITGGGGSIGSELCRQVMRFSPKLLVIFDIYENNAYELECELRQNFNGSCREEVVIGSIRDIRRLQEVFAKYKPEVVFHAAAHKHVPLMEKSYGEAIKNNIFGTRNLLEVSAASGVERFVMLSTDKAVNPTNIMGATKRINEMMVQVFAKESGMKCMMVRFGNVLGSHGSVIPLFEMQIKKGGPVTVTHPDIVRYFMTIPEAAQLVLQAGSFAQNGALYALDMGEPIRIIDLAEKIIRFYGYEPNVDMPIKITGLRPGEKLYEELISEKELQRLIATENKKIFVVPTDNIDEKLFYERLARLEREVEGGVFEGETRKAVIQRLIRELVPCYTPNGNGGKQEQKPEPVQAQQNQREDIAPSAMPSYQAQSGI
ncbi:MAG: UDP-N-acetyl-alpha-D-glucosamine C6 dehydratase [Firmicutes bacterium ADurb.Bin248]|nr:MAG: UDP-N-acetyl-alpha-D-glucosamine C6 dehydratase [Firmicutes bacterium ADurb.Bin248]